VSLLLLGYTKRHCLRMGRRLDLLDIWERVEDLLRFFVLDICWH
jgi:hypothetical protein